MKRDKTEEAVEHMKSMKGTLPFIDDFSARLYIKTVKVIATIFALLVVVSLIPV